MRARREKIEAPANLWFVNVAAEQRKASWTCESCPDQSLTRVVLPALLRLWWTTYRKRELFVRPLLDVWFANACTFSRRTIWKLGLRDSRDPDDLTRAELLTDRGQADAGSLASSW